MNKTMTIGYQNRQGRTRDLPTVPKIIIANHILEKCGFLIGKKVNIFYSSCEITIKLT